MRRALTTCLVLLALAGVASGDLLKPCDCHRGGEGDPHARCRAPAPAPVAPRCAACCGREADREGGEAPSDTGRGDGEEGCTICCKPRPPLEEADAIVVVDAPTFAALAPVDEVPVAWRAPEPVARPLEADRRTSDPWLLSPEGLSVFLI